MLLQARIQALPELLIIAAGLSIPDPRERPEEKRELANAAHKAFAAPESDFLTLLKIWNACPETTGKSRNALRKFCKSNFLSFTHMQEWRDVWNQLCDCFRDDLKNQSSAPSASPPLCGQSERPGSSDLPQRRGQEQRTRRRE